jgi:hypothetical protein
MDLEMKNGEMMSLGMFVERMDRISTAFPRRRKMPSSTPWAG